MRRALAPTIVTATGWLFVIGCGFGRARMDSPLSAPPAPDAPVQRRLAYRPLFNGHDFDGWTGDMRNWSVEGGVMVGRARGLGRPILLTHRETFRDFQLELSVRVANA